MHLPLSVREEFLAMQIVNIAFEIHRELGPGLLESIYAKCFTVALKNKQIRFEKQQEVPIVFQAELIEQDGLRLDLIVEDLVIVEFKAQDNFHPVWEAQLLSYLKLSRKRIGLLINFHVPLIKNGIKRIAL